MTTPTATGFTVDRKISLSVLAVVVLQIFGGAWWAATTEARLTVVESTVAKAEGERAALRDTLYDARERLIRMEQATQQNQHLLTQILDKLE